MNIMDVGGQDIKACAQFQYKGWTISFSTIFRGASVFAFKDTEELIFQSVENAIEAINQKE